MLCSEHERWLYRLDASFSWSSHCDLGRDWAFQDSEGKTRLILTREGEIIVLAGYAWDGCTPKLFLLDVVVGTPDGVVSKTTGRPKTYHASLVHDALYQFLPLDGVPFTRKRADAFFLRLMAEQSFLPRHVYYLAVRAFGWMTRPVTRRLRRWTGGHRLDCSELAATSEGSTEP